MKTLAILVGLALPVQSPMQAPFIPQAIVISGEERQALVLRMRQADTAIDMLQERLYRCESTRWL